MSESEIMFLAIVALAFATFIGTLSLVAWWTERQPKAATKSAS
jgi:hypothetical protein